MPRIDFREIPPTTGDSSDPDAFEKFCREFFHHVLRRAVLTQPSRGADGGLDLKLKNIDGRTCLVSCKHYASSQRSVGRYNEEDIVDRLHEHGCDIFVGFYSTIASTGLREKLTRLREQGKIEFELFDSAAIEHWLLEGTRGFEVARRFFPNSVQNIAPRIISLLPTYKPEEAIPVEPEIWKFVDSSGNDIVIGSDKRKLAKIANERAMLDYHAAPYLRAWKDAAKLYPNFFDAPQTGVDSASTVNQLPPAWKNTHMISELSPMERSFIGAVWSLYDEARSKQEITKARVDTWGKTVSAPTLGHLTGTATERRDILARLLAFHTPNA